MDQSRSREIEKEKQKMNTTTLLISALFITAQSMAAIQVNSTPKTGKVEFEAVGKPSMIKIKGTGEGVTSKLHVDKNKVAGEITFKLDSLKTGIEMRDEHMKNKYLEVLKNPTAKITINGMTMPAEWTLQNPAVTNAAFKAKLNLHGVEKEITGALTIAGKDLQTNAEFEIKLSDFGIEIPQYLGIKVADLVKIKISVDKMTAIKL